MFASATLSLAVLERLVHSDTDLQPVDLVAVEIEIPPGVRIDSVNVTELPRNWRAFPAPPELAAIGARWLRDARTVALVVPSAAVPLERNVILNPAHADFTAIRLGPLEPFTFDPRLWKAR